MEITNSISIKASPYLKEEDLREMVEYVLDSESAKERRRELALSDFRLWVHDTVRAICEKIGATVQRFEELWRDLEQSIQFFKEDFQEGFNAGREYVHKKAELRRTRRQIERDRHRRAQQNKGVY